MEKQKYYYVYKITNKINNKTYVGCHETYDINDGYMGSGTLIKRAISKYGINNFTKEIISQHNNRRSMFDEERIIIESNNPSYNLTVGGRGGFNYINKNGLNLYKDRREEAHKKIAIALRNNHKVVIKKYNTSPNKCSYCLKKLSYEQRHNKFCSTSCSSSVTSVGRRHTEYTKNKIREKLRYKREVCSVCSKELPLGNISGYCRKHIPYKHNLSDNDIINIRLLHPQKSYREISKNYNVSHVTIYNIVKCKRSYM